MNSTSVEYQTNFYLFQLNNSANESGFKADDSWELKVVDQKEMTRLSRAYAPVVIGEIIPEILSEVFQSIKIRLNQSLNQEEQNLNKTTIAAQNLNFIVAYNTKRERR